MNLLEAALSYAARGWAVFPLSPGSKIPLSATKGHHDATTDPEIIRSWWGATPSANIGISLDPSGLVVLDVDVSGDKQGAQSLDSIEEHLTPTLAAKTGRGGTHGLYTRPEGLEPRRKIGFLPGLDLLGLGYIVAAPSSLATGGVYTWVNEGHEIALLPDVLRDVFGAKPEIIQSSSVERTKIAEGGRNNALFRFGASLRDTGIGEEALRLALLSENTKRFTSPLPEQEVTELAAKICRNVAPTRDVLAGAIVEEESRARWEAKGWITPSSPDKALSRLICDVAGENRPAKTVIKTGFSFLDSAIGGGFMSGTLHVFMGPPGAGKSAWAVTASLFVAQSGHPVLYACTELQSDEITARHAAPLFDKPWTVIERGIDPERSLVQAKLQGLPVSVMGSEVLPRGMVALDAIEHEIVRLTNVHNKPPVVFVDYLQDLARGAEQDTITMIGELASKLHLMAQKHDCVINAISSVNRSWYGANKSETLRNVDDPTIFMSAAKESGDVDYAAATVVFLDVLTEHLEDGKPARLVVAKARRGMPAFVGARFFGAIGKWISAPEALIEMKPENRRDKQAEAKESSLRERLLSCITIRGEQSIKSLKTAIGGKNDGSLQHMLTKLVDEKVLGQRPGEYGKFYLLSKPLLPDVLKESKT